MLTRNSSRSNGKHLHYFRQLTRDPISRFDTDSLPERRTIFPLPGFPEVVSGIGHEVTDIAGVKSLGGDIISIDFLPLNQVNR